MNDNIFDMFISKLAKENQRIIPPIVAEIMDQKLLTGSIKANLEDPTLNIDSAAQLLKISKQSVYQNIKKIPHRKIFGRLVFLRAELLEFIDNNGKVVRNKGDP